MTRRRVLDGALVGLVLIAVVLVLAAMQAVRRDDGASNVDDFLYARQTAVVWDSITSGSIGIVDAWRLFAVNSPLVPTLAAPLAAFDDSPMVLVLVQGPLVLALVLALAGLLRELGVRGSARWPAAGVVVLLPPALVYSAMLSFALAASLTLVLSLLAYLRSDRLRDRRTTLLLGGALGLLALSRVVALVYAAALLAPVALDLLRDRSDVRARLRNGALGAAVALVLSGPWWGTAGPKALHYLLTAGYGTTVFTTDRGLVGKQLDRLTHTADETGWLLAWALLVATLLALLVCAVRRDRAWVLTTATVVLGMVGLGSSSNAGTAFALPMELLAATLGLAVVGQLRWSWVRRPLAVSVTLAALASTAAVFRTAPPQTTEAGRPLWLSGLPVRQQYEQALACRCPLPDAEQLNAEVYRVVSDGLLLVLRDDALVNPETLRFLAYRDGGRTAELTAPAGTDPALDPAILRGVDYVLAGRTAGPYHAVDLAGAEAVLRTAGFTPVLDRRLSDANQVVIWAAPGRGSGPADR